MRHILMVSVFVVGLFVKVSTAAGAMEEAQFINNNNNNNNNNAAASAAAVETIVVPQAPPVYSAPSNVNNTNVTVGANPVGIQNATRAEIAYGRRHNYTPAYDEGDASILVKDFHRDSFATITPMIGGTFYGGGWNSYVRNQVSLGVAIDIPVSYLVSFEIEGGYGRFTRVPAPLQPGSGRSFDLWNLGGNMKFYFTRRVVRPWVGAGLVANYYDNVFIPPTPGQWGAPSTSQVIGSGQLLGGFEVCLGDNIAIGARGAWVVPMFNRPNTLDNGAFNAPAFVDAAMINTSFYKLMGTVSIGL